MERMLRLIFISALIWACNKSTEPGQDTAGVCTETQNQCGVTASVTGSVVSADKQPVADADVELFVKSGTILKKTSAIAAIDSSVGKTKTDADGKFAFTKLPGGDFVLKAIKDSMGSTQDFSLKKDENKDLGSITIINNGIIIGRVDRSIVQQAENAYAVINEIGVQTNISKAGDYTFNNVPVYNNYTITIYNGDNVVPSNMDKAVVAVQSGKTTFVDTAGVSTVIAKSDGALSPLEVAAITPAEIQKFSNPQITALGTNIKYLGSAALGALTGNQIFYGITPDQIAVLTTAQVRLLGSTGAAGATTTAKISSLNTETWATLVRDSNQVAAFTADEVKTLSNEQIPALGKNIKYLSDAALGVLTGTQIFYGITPDEIAVLTPAQVRQLGATGAAGATTTAKIASLNKEAWATLVRDSNQVAAFTADEVKTLSNEQIPALGKNIKHLGSEALGALTGTQIFYGITPDEIAVLTPAQVRLLGTTGAAGATTTAKISSLNTETWATLVRDSNQVAAFTADEVKTLSNEQIPALGKNIKHLSNAALGILTGNQIFYGITPVEIAVLTPAQVRQLGATGPAGAATTAKISSLNTEAWATLVRDSNQVTAFTAEEIKTLSNAQITALGKNIKYLMNAALGVLTGGQIFYGITPEQISALSPEQFGVIAGVNNNTGISSLNAEAFASLSPAQIAILTAAQKASLSAAQHTACGC